MKWQSFRSLQRSGQRGIHSPQSNMYGENMAINLQVESKYQEMENKSSWEKGLQQLSSQDLNGLNFEELLQKHNLTWEFWG